MPSSFAALSALLVSREAIATMSLHSPFCIAGMALVSAKWAVLRTPQRTLSRIVIFLPPLPQERRSAPQNWRLPMQIASLALALQIILQVFVFPRAFAYIANVAIRFYVTDQPEPAFARRGRVVLFI